MEVGRAAYYGKLKAFKWWGPCVHVQCMAWRNNLDLKMDSEKGFLRETVTFRVIGTMDNIAKFRCDLGANSKLRGG